MLHTHVFVRFCTSIIGEGRKAAKASKYILHPRCKATGSDAACRSRSGNGKRCAESVEYTVMHTPPEPVQFL
jgi:hypothetical protein